MRECVSHHHACDCREQKFRCLEEENAALRRRILDYEQAEEHHVEVANSLADRIEELLNTELADDSSGERVINTKGEL